MDEEAFSETENIALLNAYFISLRVENAQRPDVDARYNLNGWPTIAFMTPAGRIARASSTICRRTEFKEFSSTFISPISSKERFVPRRKTRAPGSDATLARIGGWQSICCARDYRERHGLADRTNGGYDRGQKFIHPQVNDFLLERYEATKDKRYLDQVCLTLERMRAGEIYDHQGGAYFRTSSNADWSHPHREKLLIGRGRPAGQLLVGLSHHATGGISPHGRRDHSSTWMPSFSIRRAGHFSVAKIGCAMKLRLPKARNFSR